MVDMSRLIFRRFNEADLGQLHTMLMASPEMARYPEEISMEGLQSQLGWPGHVPERDRWIVVDPSTQGGLIGYSSMFKSPETSHADCIVVVRPEHRRLGIGAELVAKVMDDARVLGAREVAGYVNALDEGASAFALTFGARVVGAYTRLRKSNALDIQPVAWPEGYCLRTWRGDEDLMTLVDASNQCYDGLSGHNLATAESWELWLPSMDTRGIFFLFDEHAAVIGIVRASPAKVDGRVIGQIDAPGVVRRLRGGDLYLQLLLSAMAWLASEGAVEYELESWGDDPAVLDCYRTLGFLTMRRETMYSVSLAVRGA
ncbi:MAG TPA: GNAT family N-acetyltransferase [Ktedonobacterales bacterium]